MSSPYPVSSLFGALFFLVRHSPDASADHSALAAALRAAQGPGEMRIEIEPELLLINGDPVMLESPGATMLFEQMYLHGVRSLRMAASATDFDIIRFASVLGAFPGTYDSFEQVMAALGPSAERLTLTQGANDFEVFRSAMPWRSRGGYGSREEDTPRLDPPRNRGEITAEYERFQELALNPDIAPELDPAAPSVGSIHRVRPSLEELLRRGRVSIEREDWGGLLEIALLIAEGESESPSELTSSTYRIELKRLMSRKHLAMVARFLQGERKQDAIALLRRFGADSTEILMDLLVQATTISERRGYYSAITQMSDGSSEAVVQHLGHQQWYVVRNAADLCGEMGLAEAVPHLAKQVAHPDERVRKAVAEALGKIGTLPAMEPLRALIADSSAAVRLKAVAHLTGRYARGMPPAIAELLKTEEVPEVQYEAMLALGRIATPDAIAQLREWSQPGGKLLGRKPLAVRLAAVRGLALAGPAAADVLPALERDDAPEIRSAARAAVAALHP